MDIPDISPIDNKPYAIYSEVTSSTPRKYFNEIINDLATSGKEVLGHNLKLKNPNNFDAEECAICFGIFDNKNKIASLECLHFFHNSCAISYREKTLLCPICRAESKSYNCFNSLRDLINNINLECTNNSCYYSAKVSKIDKIIAASEDNKTLLHNLNKDTRDKIKDIIIAEIEDTFNTEDSGDYLEKNKHLLEKLIKKLKFVYHSVNYDCLDKFMDNYEQLYHCPYPKYNFYKQDVPNFLQENEKIIICVFKKIILDNLKSRIKITKANYDPENDQILITVAYSDNEVNLSYNSAEEYENNLDIYNQILEYLYIDIMMLKLSLDYSNFFKKNKPIHIDSWSSKDNLMKIQNEDDYIDIRLTDFFDNENKKINFEKLRHIIAEHNIDYKKLHEPAKEVKLTNNTDNNNVAVDVEDTNNIRTETSLNIGSGFILTSYKIFLPNLPVELAYESSPDNLSTTFFIKILSSGERYKFKYEFQRIE